MRPPSEQPTFDAVFLRVRAAGRADVVSSIGTRYSMTAEVSGGRRVLIARPRSGQVRIHEDCWGQDLTCQGTRAGGAFNGSPSIYDWYEAHR
ncbi:MAG: hypothetical protein HY303_02345 [Candidatus Wallbacteria bacterium]|nr:hypothetical protein [Candidatus Wallbacteria bacterium]